MKISDSVDGKQVLPVKGKQNIYQFTCRHLQRYQHNSILPVPPNKSVVYAFVKNDEPGKPKLLYLDHSDNLFIPYSSIPQFQAIFDLKPDYMIFFETNDPYSVEWDIKSPEFFNLDNLFSIS